MNKPHFLLAVVVVTLSACSGPETPPVKVEAVPWVRTCLLYTSDAADE